MKRFLVSRTFPLAVNSLRGKDKIVSPAWSSESKSCNLLLQTGMIVHSSPGIFHYTPLMLRSLHKLEALIDKSMARINGQKIQMSCLGNNAMWKKSGRWQQFGGELIKTQIGLSRFCLSPTHEEAVCEIMSSYIKQLSYTHLPIRLYQTTMKYRGELRPHSGLLRCREFLMNDLYTFDVDTKSAIETYNQVMEMYENLFELLGINVLKASARSDLIGGTMSHEYHIPCDIGEDIIAVCNETKQAWNLEHPEAKKESDRSDIKLVKGIEVGHVFLLGNKYSKTFNSVYVDCSGQAIPCEMGCYGLGVSRIVGACLEVLSSEKQMRWPDHLAPYKVCIVPPKAGSKEERCLSDNLVYDVYDSLQEISSVKDDVIIDDRINHTIGWRLQQANVLGYPVVIVLGKGLKNDEQTVEVIFQGKENVTQNIPLPNVVKYITQRFSKNHTQH